MKRKRVPEDLYNTILWRLHKECNICYLQFFDMATEEFYQKFSQYIIPDYKVGPNLAKCLYQSTPQALVLRVDFELINNFIFYKSFYEFAEIFECTHIIFACDDDVWLSNFTENGTYIEFPNGKLSEYVGDYKEKGERG